MSEKITFTTRKFKRQNIRKVPKEKSDEGETVDMKKIEEFQLKQKFQTPIPTGISSDSLLKSANKKEEASETSKIDRALERIVGDGDSTLDKDAMNALRSYVYEKMAKKATDSPETQYDESLLSLIKSPQRKKTETKVVSLSLTEHELPISYKMKNLEETEVTRNQMMQSLAEMKRNLDDERIPGVSLPIRVSKKRPRR